MSSNASFWDKPAAQAHYLDNKQKTQSPGLSGIYKQAVEVGNTTSAIVRILACSTVATEGSKAAVDSHAQPAAGCVNEYQSRITACCMNPTQACKSAVPAEGQAVILDVACAGGEPALTIAQALPDAVVHATDYSAGMVAALQSRLQGEFSGKCSNIIADTANGEQLQQFADSSVHAVTCSLGLMFMPNWQKALSEVKLSELDCTFQFPSVEVLYQKFVLGTPAGGCIAAAKQAGNSAAASEARTLYDTLVQATAIVQEDGSVSSNKKDTALKLCRHYIVSSNCCCGATASAGSLLMLRDASYSGALKRQLKYSKLR
eukprot:10460-Heterococcus_DN1.PRE.4